jgi:hypothetical protein
MAHVGEPFDPAEGVSLAELRASGRIKAVTGPPPLEIPLDLSPEAAAAFEAALREFWREMRALHRELFVANGWPAEIVPDD